ncbi:MAG: hypothetical protein ACC645_00695 [Pirellulales bacterium]
MNGPVPEDDPIRDELVAYLDGEIDSEARRRLEGRLTRDPATRRELEQFQRAWECLDVLPAATVSESFASTTIEMVAVTAEREQSGWPLTRFARRHRRWTALAVGLVAGLLGYAVVAARWPDTDRLLLRERRLLERLDVYLEIDDIGYLRRLREEGLFTEEPYDASR